MVRDRLQRGSGERAEKPLDGVALLGLGLGLRRLVRVRVRVRV